MADAHPVPLFRADAMRRLWLAGWLPLSAPFAIAAWLLLGAAWGRRGHAPLSVAAGLALGYALLREGILQYEAAHRAEARRLGYAAERIGSGWNPCSWLARGLFLTLRPMRPAEGGAFLEQDALLIRLTGHEAAERSLVRKSVLPSGVGAPLLVLCAAAAAWGPRTGGVWSALLSLIAGAAALLAWRDSRRAARRLACSVGPPEPSLRFGARPPGYWAWPFWRLRLQRSLDKNQTHLRRDLRLVMRLEAGLREGHLVLELGSGSGSLREHLRPSPRIMWVNLDADRLALRDAQTRSPEALLIHADAKKLPLKDRCVDVVAGLAFFDSVHLEQLDSILSEARRVLKRGGRLVHLEDFTDWPGPALAEQFNLLLEGVLPSSPVKFLKAEMRLVFPSLRPPEAARVQRELSAAAEGRAPAWRDRLHVLRRALRRQDLPRPPLANPRLLFNSLLARALARHGFEVISRGRELEPDLLYVSYLVARRKD